MKCQKELFSMREGVYYLNCAYKSPLLKASEQACMQALIRERNPIDISADDFFEDSQTVREYFAQIVHAQASNIAIIPSTSYGFASVLQNIEGKPNGEAITLKDEFPSAYYSLDRWCKERDQQLKVVAPVAHTDNKGQSWNENILQEITVHTSVVLISAIHWMNGIRFDLKAIGEKCAEVGAKFIVDGTQSVGALEIDVEACRIDVLVCASYKWLFGAYSIALAYIADEFSNGKPLEEAYVNRVNAKNFSALTDYTNDYKPASGRYNVGEHNNFISMPIVRTSLQQVIAWQPKAIEAYCLDLIQPLIVYLKKLGVTITMDQYFSPHLFSLSLPASIDLNLLKTVLQKKQVIVSVRGQFIRVSVNVFNDAEDIEKLIEAIEETVNLG